MDSTIFLVFHLLYVAFSIVYIMYSIIHALMYKRMVGFDIITFVTMKSVIFCVVTSFNSDLYQTTRRHNPADSTHKDDYQ
jgi:hypothetical protein